MLYSEYEAQTGKPHPDAQSFYCSLAGRSRQHENLKSAETADNDSNKEAVEASTAEQTETVTC